MLEFKQKVSGGLKLLHTRGIVINFRLRVQHVICLPLLFLFRTVVANSMHK